MPRGRHRHSQPLHRLLPPVAIAAAGLACAGGSWFVGEAGFSDTGTVVLRGLTAVAALAGATGAVLARRWDRGAGRRVGELKARESSLRWRTEERQAELEADLEESRAIRDALDRKLRGKQSELTRMRSEHAALLRRYAHAETELAGVLEGRRLLELEAGDTNDPGRALEAGAADHRTPSGAPTALTYLQAGEALRHLRRSAERQRQAGTGETLGRDDTEGDTEAGSEAGSGAGTEASAADAAARGAVPAADPKPATSSVTPSQNEDHGRGPDPQGDGFDFFGNNKPARAAEAEPARWSSRQGEPGGETDARPEPALEPATPPRTARGAAGKVVHLADEEAGAAESLDITELRDAVS